MNKKIHDSCLSIFDRRDKINMVCLINKTKLSAFLYQKIKRILDILLSLFLLILIFPILLLSATIIMLTEGSPVFYLSKRCISESKEITIIKFRTMVRDATSIKYNLMERYMNNGYLNIPLECEVYTPFGRFLERFQIVELLQLFNVIFHGMSLIGNRPLPKDNLKYFNQFSNFKKRFEAPMGITGLSQVVGKFNLTPQERLNLEQLYTQAYQTKNILKLDLWIFYKTILLILLKQEVPYQEAIRKFTE